MNAPRFVAVRIAVAVNAAGEWSATGWDDWTDAQAEACAKQECGDAPARLTWVTALCPLPAPVVEIVGVVPS